MEDLSTKNLDELIHFLASNNKDLTAKQTAAALLIIAKELKQLGETSDPLKQAMKS